MPPFLPAPGPTYAGADWGRAARGKSSAVGASRSQAQRDESTVESMYVAVSAVLLAGAAFALVASPALVFGVVHGDARRVLIICGKWAGAGVFLARLISGLWRW
ncbi:DUF6332 family protein [Streptomyces fagopyri]